ncbi:glycosyltransferase family 28 protein [Litoreibacter sp.]|nr:glycosyltransferase family 28 protein [Litoreibacter sp.]
MIFVTVGTQLPFPRLIDAMDDLAGCISEPVVAQTAVACRAQNLIVEPIMSAQRYHHVLGLSRLVISHAGIGTVIAARDAETPLILVPRRAELGEHRNDHQLSTVRELIGRQGVEVVWNTDDLAELVTQEFVPPLAASGPALDGLVSRLRSFIG